MSDRYPQYTVCRHCKGIARRDHRGDPWTIYGPAETRSSECRKAPNPEDGPMPPHEPGRIVEPPAVA